MSDFEFIFNNLRDIEMVYTIYLLIYFEKWVLFNAHFVKYPIVSVYLFSPFLTMTPKQQSDVILSLIKYLKHHSTKFDVV